MLRCAGQRRHFQVTNFLSMWPPFLHVSASSFLVRFERGSFTDNASQRWPHERNQLKTETRISL